MEKKIRIKGLRKGKVKSKEEPCSYVNFIPYEEEVEIAGNYFLHWGSCDDDCIKSCNEQLVNNCSAVENLDAQGPRRRV